MDIFEGRYSVCHRDSLNLGVASKEFPERDDRVQPAEEAGRACRGWRGQNLTY